MGNLTELEWKQYACLLGSKQMPPIASHFSRKKLKYRQRLAKRKELGDMAMNAMAFNVPMQEELMKSPMAQFIIFSANDFGYSGSA